MLGQLPEAVPAAGVVVAEAAGVELLEESRLDAA
jgi:hypothetical protein